MSSSSAHVVAPKVYWVSWSILLAFTIVMLWLDTAAVPRLAFVLLMIAAMLTKATIIGGNFMHLRAERLSLVLIVIVGLLITGALLFALIAPDAARIHQMVAQP